MLGVSDVLGYVSMTCWLGAQFPQVVENIRCQSCEGLALPFLANWFMGDVSNLLGCILTHQLPFQKWLATYFVFVDLILVVQYAYYYKAPKRSLSALSHIRSATSPAGIDRRRSASRYRTLSVVASNVAAAAAVAAQQDGHRTPSARYSQKSDQQRLYERSSSDASGRLIDGNPGYDDEGDPPTMADSYYSDGGREISGKRVSWSTERHRTRAASVGRVPTALQILPTNPLADLDVQSNENPSNESLSPVVSRRGSRASRRGSTMVFLGAWALFGIGTLASKRPSMLMSTTNDIGRVLVSGHNLEILTPVYHSHLDTFLSNPSANELDTSDSEISYLRDDTHDAPPLKQPSSQQILGRIFAWLCTTLYLTSRLPQIWKNYVRKSVEGLSMYLFVFAFLGNVFYVASILSSPRNFLPPPQSTQFLRESIPYLLGSGGTLMFDITIVGQSFCYRPRPRRHLSTHGRASDEEEAGLLSADALSPHPPGESAIMNRGRPSRSRGAA